MTSMIVISSCCELLLVPIKIEIFLQGRIFTKYLTMQDVQQGFNMSYTVELADFKVCVSVQNQRWLLQKPLDL